MDAGEGGPSTKGVLVIPCIPSFGNGPPRKALRESPVSLPKPIMRRDRGTPRKGSFHLGEEARQVQIVGAVLDHRQKRLV
jgi:hypothetical protein